MNYAEETVLTSFTAGLIIWEVPC